MKLAYPQINEVIEISAYKINTVIIENPTLLYSLICDLREQVNKKEGKAVLSFNNELLDISKEIELLTDVYGLDLNSKSILNKISEELLKKIVDEVHYEKTMQLISALEMYFADLVWDMECELECGEITPKHLLKAISFNIVDDNIVLAERILKYLEIIREYMGEKLFVMVNFRAFLEADAFEKMCETIVRNEFRVLFIENKEYPLLINENRRIIDIDLCEF